MANEMKHGTVGTELTQAEWEGIGTHVLDSQATGDVIYAASSSQLRRLAAGTDTHVLTMTSGIPAWSVTTGITTVGTIATGVWQATDVGVAYGGTGASTLTANGVLIGNGSSAITSVDMSTKGHVLVGDGSGNPQMLAVGTNTHVLTADSGETTGTKWSAVTATGALDSGSITSGFGNIDVGASSIAAGSFDASDGNISNVGDIALDSISADATSIELKADVSITGTTPLLTIGDGGAEDAGMIFDGTELDYHFGLQDGHDAMVLGKGTTFGTTPIQYWDLDDATAGPLISFGSTPSSTYPFKLAQVNASTAQHGAMQWFWSQVTIDPSSDGNWQGLHIDNRFIMAAGSSTNNIRNLRVDPPAITDADSGDRGTINNDTVALYVSGAFSDGNSIVTGTDYAVHVDGGYTRLDGGVIVGATSSTNNLIDDASTGSGSTTLYIGNQSITSSSDERLKRNIEDTKVDALQTLAELRIVDFDWVDPTDISPNNKAARGRWTGMLAQETVQIVPHIINAPRDEQGEIEYDSDNIWMVDYQHLVPMLVKAIQEIDDKLSVM